VKKKPSFLKVFYIYILKELTLLFTVSLFLITFILVLGRIRKLTELIINRGVELKDIFFLFLYSSPPSLTFTLPMAFLLSVIVVLGRLSSENEILTLKTSGVNLKRIFIPISFFGLLIGLFGLLNTFVFLPKSGDLFRDTLINIVKKGITIEDREGVFNDSIPGIVIYIEKVDNKKRYLSGIIVSDEREPNVTQIVTAKKGFINFDAPTMRLTFVLKDGALHRYEKEKDTYRNLSFGDYNFTLDISSFLPKARVARKRPYEMGMGELKEIIRKEKDYSKRYDMLLEMYKKLSLPLASISFILLAVPLGIGRRKEGKFTGITFSLFLFLAYYLFMAFTDYLGKTLNLPPLFVAFLPNLSAGLLGIYLAKDLNEEQHVIPVQKIKIFRRFGFEKAG
jgi:lipopolysaccharide export system permease protein